MNEKIDNKNLTLREIQQMVDEWIKTYGVRYFSELTNMACLTEEVGAGSMETNPSRKVRRRILQKKWQTSCGYWSVWPIRPM